MKAYFQIVCRDRSDLMDLDHLPLHKIIPEEFRFNIQMAATGDQGFEWRRENISVPLLDHKIASIIFEIPYYGIRRPRNQVQSALREVSDLGIMFLCIVAEGCGMVHWLKSQGFQAPFGISGLSMGGSAAVYTGLMCDQDLAITAMLASHSPEAVYTEGVMSRNIAFDALTTHGETEEDARKRLELYLIEYGKYPPTSIRHRISFNQVNALHDGYIPKHSALKLASQMSSITPAVKMRWITGGHVWAFVYHKHTYLNAIIESFGLFYKTFHN
eukprot:TRINITY_DN3359_c0_g1_i2.p1 TRINITY_DN3359_c0_g1~~TRINITY_DN3359_c0_g1_i2.p1  ORF type:complete len:272 (+),score=25.55 TRINITY_DN3359_c0_g1_i2:336-1151(+)